MVSFAKILGIVGVFMISMFVLVAAKNFFDTQLGSLPTTVTVTAVGAKEQGSGVNGEVQVVQLTMKDFNYYPNVLNLKYNVPARIVVDMSKVKGCLQSIVIPAFGVRKTVTANDNVISFLPNKKGTFSFSCSMGMGFGKIVVS